MIGREARQTGESVHARQEAESIVYGMQGDPGDHELWKKSVRLIIGFWRDGLFNTDRLLATRRTVDALHSPKCSRRHDKFILPIRKNY